MFSINYLMRSHKSVLGKNVKWYMKSLGFGDRFMASYTIKGHFWFHILQFKPKRFLFMVFKIWC